MSLEEAVSRYRAHVVALPGKIKPKELLRKRSLPSYWSLGIATPVGLATALVQDRLVASREMAMGYLYEIVLVEVCGARKLTNREKKKWRGVDFRREVGRDVQLINLKSARATSNSDISGATMANLAAAYLLEAREMEEREAGGDDNPLAGKLGTVTAIRAIARGVASDNDKPFQGGKIRILIGDSLWEELGAGPGYGRKIQLAIGRNPVNLAALEAATQQAIERVVAEIQRSECVRQDGTLDWECLLEKFPDA